jgi:hypothetical protein
VLSVAEREAAAGLVTKVEDPGATTKATKVAKATKATKPTKALGATKAKAGKKA